MKRLTIEQRKAVQFVRDAHMVKIEAFGDDGTSLRFVFENYKPFKKVIHDIAIALQDFYNNTDTLRAGKHMATEVTAKSFLTLDFLSDSGFRPDKPR